MTEDDSGSDSKSPKADERDNSKAKAAIEDAVEKQSMEYKAKLAALEKLANPLNESALAAIKKMADQQNHVADLYKQSMRFPKIAEMFAKNQADQMKAIQKAATSGITESLKKITESPISQIVKQIDERNVSSARQVANLGADIMRAERERHEIARREREYRQQVGDATIEQSEHLANLAEQNAILVNAVTQLLEHTVSFEKAKADGAQRQFDISVWALWAAVISAIISLAGLFYSIFWQKPPEVTVNPPVVNVSAPPPNLEPLLKQIELQTTELKEIGSKLSKPKTETKKKDSPQN